MQDEENEDVGEEAASFWGQVAGPVHDDGPHDRHGQRVGQPQDGDWRREGEG